MIFLSSDLHFLQKKSLWACQIELFIWKFKIHRNLYCQIVLVCCIATMRKLTQSLHLFIIRWNWNYSHEIEMSMEFGTKISKICCIKTDVQSIWGWLFWLFFPSTFLIPLHFQPQSQTQNETELLINTFLKWNILENGTKPAVH